LLENKGKMVNDYYGRKVIDNIMEEVAFDLGLEA
jgi:hypothetical protein